MMIDTLKTLFARDLNKLKTEIELYGDEKNLWLIDKNISNSAGNLCLHLIGNLNTYIGVALAQSNYIRERDLEFSSKNVPREQLLQMIDKVTAVVEAGLSTLRPDEMPSDFPMVIWDKPTEMEFTLVHLYGHLNYHLGQINYHRRLLDGEVC